MMVLGGFVTVLGLSAVAYALTVLHAPFLVTAFIITALGLAAWYDSISFFSTPIALNVSQFDAPSLRHLLRPPLPEMIPSPRIEPFMSGPTISNFQILRSILIHEFNPQIDSNLRLNSLFNSNMSRALTVQNDNQATIIPDLSTQSASINDIY